MKSKKNNIMPVDYIYANDTVFKNKVNKSKKKEIKNSKKPPKPTPYDNNLIK